ncbi:MAG: hypothetical protein JWQ94_1241 [Tardiphaga sp.]|jgi:hypothetical protein|nr:hypothetical protein [Tardiphaga sp.]
MTSSYSIEKIGNGYVVKVDNQSVMTVGNRRKAERLVAEASGMLDQTESSPAEATNPKAFRPANRR